MRNLVKRKVDELPWWNRIYTINIEVLYFFLLFIQTNYEEIYWKIIRKIKELHSRQKLASLHYSYSFYQWYIDRSNVRQKQQRKAKSSNSDDPSVDWYKLILHWFDPDSASIAHYKVNFCGAGDGWKVSLNLFCTVSWMELMKFSW